MIMKKEMLKMGFPPVFDENSRVLVLGSFPSVKSREISFYYGNKQNRFWKTVCGFFEADIPETTEGKIDFLKKNSIALWDMVTECEIEGSADSSIRLKSTADLYPIFRVAKIEKVLLNGTLSYELFEKEYAEYCKNNRIEYAKMPSTSPANPRFTKEKWEQELQCLIKT